MNETRIHRLYLYYFNLNQMTRYTIQTIMYPKSKLTIYQHYKPIKNCTHRAQFIINNTYYIRVLYMYILNGFPIGICQHPYSIL